MLVLTSKKYEIEEPVVVKDENGIEKYKFDMQITSIFTQLIQKILSNSILVSLLQNIQQNQDV